MVILNIIGTRPEAIKMAPVIRELGRRPERARSLTCVTGQHRDLVDPVLELFALQPDYALDVMRPGQSLAQLTASLLEALDPVIEECRPDWVLAQGDTATALAAALAASFRQVPFAHVEAGLRTADKFTPFPEELNRRLTDKAADLWFAPTTRAQDNLLREGFPRQRIHVTGNPGIDALLEIAERPFRWKQNQRIGAAIDPKRPLVLVTTHRREHFGEPLRAICLAIHELALRYDKAGVQFVWPVHPNPEVQRPVQELLADAPAVHLVAPLDYLTTVHLMKRAALVLTDSGGLQEEAPTLGVPVVVMRQTTERPEGVEAGLVNLAGTDSEAIVECARGILDSPVRELTGERRVPATTLYGDGRAAQRIADLLLDGSRRGRSRSAALAEGARG
jgi:UDP-N-acetylglucosamine 2-epimerase